MEASCTYTVHLVNGHTVQMHICSIDPEIGAIVGIRMSDRAPMFIPKHGFTQIVTMSSDHSHSGNGKSGDAIESLPTVHEFSACISPHANDVKVKDDLHADTLSPEEIQQNLDRIIAELAKARIPYEITAAIVDSETTPVPGTGRDPTDKLHSNPYGVLTILDSVRVVAPFTSSQCFCPNEIVLARIRKLLWPQQFQ
jgi:hypothetical protein